MSNPVAKTFGSVRGAAGGDFFRHVYQSDYELGGKTVRMPPFYYEIRSIKVEFLASTRNVQPFLPSSRLHPLRVAPGKCLVVVRALDYLATSIGPYREVLIGIPVTIDRPSRMFIGTLWPRPEAPFVYIFRLPVTTDIALQAGIEFISAPKFLADIDFRYGPDRVACSLQQDGRLIMRLQVATGELKQAPRQHFNMLTLRDRYLLRWETLESATRRHTSRSPQDAAIELGTHAIADDLRSMALGRVVGSEYVPDGQGTFSAVLESYDMDEPALLG